VSAFLETRGGVYLAATDDGIARLDPAAPPGSARKFVAIGAPGSVFSLAEDVHGIVWAGTLGRVVQD
jgi:hypothetical protein